MPRIIETALATRAPSVTFEQILETGIVPQVKIVGCESANRRRYSPQVLARDRQRYEGAKVYLNHPRRSELSEDRDFRTWVGVLEGIDPGDDGLYANRFRLRREGLHFREIAEAATSFWADFGLSHVADCEFHKGADGFEIVESINEVFSVDVVTDPATTAGLYESIARFGVATIDESTRRRWIKALEEHHRQVDYRRRWSAAVERADRKLGVELAAPPEPPADAPPRKSASDYEGMWDAAVVRAKAKLAKGLAETGRMGRSSVIDKAVAAAERELAGEMARAIR